MSYAPVNMFYLVDSATFDKYMIRKTEDSVDIKQFPAKVSRKIKKILTYLSSVGNKWNILGCIVASADLPKNLNVLSHSAFAVTGKGPEPEHFCVFLKVLLALEVPLKFLCSKAQKKLSAIRKSQKAKKSKKGKNETKKEKEEGSNESTEEASVV